MKKFWKVFSIIMIVLLSLLIIAAIGGYIFLKNFDVKKYKPQIIEAASKALGRPVDFTDIQLNVSLDNGVRLQLQNLTIADDINFSPNPFVSVDHIDIGVDLLGFLKFKTISVPNIVIDHPQIRLIKNNSGLFNIQTIGSKPSQETAGTSASAPAAIPGLFIQSLSITNGIISVSDQSSKIPSEIALNNVHLTIKKFTLGGKFPLTLDAALNNTVDNIHIDSNIKLDLTKSAIQLSETNASINTNQLNWPQLRTFSLIPQNAPLPQKLGGLLKITSPHLSASDKGLSEGTINISWTDGSVTLPDAAPGVSLIAEKIDLNIENYSLVSPQPFHIRLQAGIFHPQPNIDLTATLNLNPQTSELSVSDASFSTDLTLWNVDVLKKNITALKDIPSPEKLSGKINVSIKTLKTDAKGLKEILADLNISDGAVLTRNLLPNSVLDIAATNLSIKNFSLHETFDFSLTTGLFNDRPNLSFDGRILFNQKQQTLKLSPASIKINLDSLPVAKIQASGLIPAGTPMPDILKGNIIADIKQFESLPKGLGNLLADVMWQNGAVSMKNLAPGVSVSAQNINIKTSGLSLNQPFDIEGSLAYENTSTNITFKNRTALNLPASSVRLSDGQVTIDLSKLSMDNIRLALEPLKDAPLPSELAGQLTIAFKDISADTKGLQNLLTDIRLTDGRVNIPRLADGMSFAASLIEANIKEFSLNQPFDFDVSLAYLNDQPNIFTKGNAQLNPTDSSVRLTQTSIKTDLSKVSLDQLRSSITALKDAPLPDILKGQLNIIINEAASGPQGLTAFVAEGSLKNASIKMKEMAAPLEELNIEFLSTDKDLTVKAMTAELGDGSLSAHALVKNFLTLPDLDASANIKNIALNDLMDQSKAPVKIQGLLSGDITASGIATDPKSIKGSGKISSAQTLIKDLNVLKTIIDKISVVPGLGQKLQNNLPQHYLDKLNNKDTAIQKADFTLSMTDGIISINPMDIQAEEFIFAGTTQASLDQSYVINGTFTIPTELATAMAKAASEIEYLLDANQAISLPVQIKGQGSAEPQFAVDAVMKDVTKKVLTNVAEKQLMKLLGVSESDTTQNPSASTPPSSTSNATQSQTQQPSSTDQQQTDPTKELIGNIFDSVFN